ncbi:hypothetical protein KIW84_052698 [Lathyrus oleraceus]|uniref:Uncharacterized protein n=1 Tax=Pisum sativum TaxID=3888 RepID=A0A9D4WQT1_PEA|nr:hypothetical protein KIW84_052697 [Pisum sativum]KAI5406038.1 hypothetical protein KIW84_052698 [Pisum sativum]
MTFKSVPVKSCGDEGVVKRASSNDVESRDRRDFDVAEKLQESNIFLHNSNLQHVTNPIPPDCKTTSVSHPAASMFIIKPRHNSYNEVPNESSQVVQSKET